MTSASRGTFSRISVSSVSRLAIINGSVAFFAPEIGIVPLRRCPPTIRIRSMPAPTSRRGASPVSCPIKEPRHILRNPLPTPSVANCGESPTVPCGRSGNLVFLAIRGLPRCFRRLRRGASAFLRLAPVQIFPQFHGKALPAFNSLLELALLGQARHGPLSGLSPHVANLIHCLRVRGFVWQFPPRLRDLFSARLAAVAQW